MDHPFKNVTEFEKLYKEYFSPLVHFLTKYTRDKEISKDLVQALFTKLWKNPNMLAPDSVKSYLFQSAKNTMIDYFRTNKKYNTTEDLTDEKTGYDGTLAIEPEQITEESFTYYLVRERIEKIIQTFKPTTREIFRMYYFEGLTQEEIAQYLKVSKRKIEYQMSIAHEQIKETITLEELLNV